MLTHLQILFHDMVNQNSYTENHLLDQLRMYQDLGYMDVGKLQDELNKLQKEIDQKVNREELKVELQNIADQITSELQPLLHDLIYYNSKELVQLDHIMNLLIDISEDLDDQNFDYLMPLLPIETSRVIIKLDNNFKPGKYNIYTDHRIVADTFIPKAENSNKLDFIFSAKLEGNKIRLKKCISHKNVEITRFSDLIITKSRSQNGIYAK